MAKIATSVVAAVVKSNYHFTEPGIRDNFLFKEIAIVRSIPVEGGMQCLFKHVFFCFFLYFSNP